MLLATAIRNLGNRVIYKQGTASEERGEIIGVHIKHDMVFVQYDGEHYDTATNPDHLTLEDTNG